MSCVFFLNHRVWEEATAPTDGRNTSVLGELLHAQPDTIFPSHRYHHPLFECLEARHLGLAQEWSSQVPSGRSAIYTQLVRLQILHLSAHWVIATQHTMGYLSFSLWPVSDPSVRSTTLASPPQPNSASIFQVMNAFASSCDKGHNALIKFH